MSTLSNKDCATLGKAMKAVPRIELCAGHKVQIKGLQKYIKYSNGTLAPSAGRKNRSGKNQPGYYLGKNKKAGAFGNGKSMNL